jgi:hypothetical protein
VRKDVVTDGSEEGRGDEQMREHVSEMGGYGGGGGKLEGSKGG